MTMQQATNALKAAEDELTRTQGRLEAARAETRRLTDAYQQSRSDEAWEAKEAAERKVQRFLLDVSGVTAERDKAAKALASATVEDYQARLEVAAQKADLGAVWQPLLATAEALYESLGKLAPRIIEESRRCRAAAQEFDALTEEARTYARSHRVAGPVVPTVSRQVPGLLTLVAFRRELVARMGVTPDSRYILVPPGQDQHAEGHLQHIAERYGVNAGDDLESFKAEGEARSRREAEAFRTQQTRERRELERKRIEEANAKLERSAQAMRDAGFSENEIPRGYYETTVEGSV